MLRDGIILFLLPRLSQTLSARLYARVLSLYYYDSLVLDHVRARACPRPAATFNPPRPCTLARLDCVISNRSSQGAGMQVAWHMMIVDLLASPFANICAFLNQPTMYVTHIVWSLELALSEHSPRSPIHTDTRTAPSNLAPTSSCIDICQHYTGPEQRVGLPLF